MSETLLSKRVLFFGLWMSLLLCLVSGYWAADQKLPFWAPTHIKSLVFYVTSISSVALALRLFRR